MGVSQIVVLFMNFLFPRSFRRFLFVDFAWIGKLFVEFLFITQKFILYAYAFFCP